MAQPLTETGADAVNGDPRARLGRLIRKQFGMVWRLARCIGLTEGEVDLAVQDVFAAAAQRIADIRPGNERAFLFGTTLHVVARVRRNRGEHAQVRDRAPALEDLDPASQAREILGASLEQMPLELRVVFVLHEIEQFASSEIAGIVGIPLGTVSERLAEAREHFASHLERESELSVSLITAAREDRAPTAALVRALQAAGVKATPGDGDSAPGSDRTPDDEKGLASALAPRRSAFFLAASWLAVGWLIGLVVVSAIWALSDAATHTTTAAPASMAR